MLVLGVVLVLIHSNLALRLGALPTSRRVVEDIQRFVAAEELAPYPEDLFQHRVDLRVSEGRKPRRRPHRPIEDGIERRGDHRALPELGRHREQFVDHAQHLLHALQMPLVVGLGARHLLDHLVQVQAHDRIRIDQLLELFEHGMEDHLAPRLHSLAMTLKPRLQLLLLGQPASAPFRVHRLRLNRHVQRATRVRPSPTRSTPHLIARPRANAWGTTAGNQATVLTRQSVGMPPLSPRLTRPG
jgi:hypothetical protein